MTTGWRIRGAAALVVALGAALGGCADYVGDDIRAGGATIPVGAENIDGTTTTTTPPEPVDPRSLDQGDCFDDVTDEDGEQPTDVTSFEAGAFVIPRSCAGEHRFELFARTDLAPADAAWPGDDALVEQADGFCSRQFEDFVGSEWSASTLEHAAQIPDEARWNAGDRLVSCALFDLGLQPLEGSMAGTGR